MLLLKSYFSLQFTMLLSATTSNKKFPGIIIRSCLEPNNFSPQRHLPAGRQTENTEKEIGFMSPLRG
ncbi:MAG: hypothetical protein A3C43_03720 [Candidatus Schekmanbacteria bacterium RIFCSPHIGHO2_02_FULL_38_11]|uniref:Uncharacterized protein n=1 Tax=Candidatus Schekmanbacteria bacterium RIFCSPLOWO2_12_FULL_38_15 TaxID=1817883 RepID=A0A1F7SQD5_9BACT|nr:MAG: hypothetical protein A2043_02800 [Candidatus Schekmanbacteria bacterium GWA2_38_9]OGL50261.1 MAG: hypothetical protein A3H37_00720 [Candidatus Schekmanbacteria bacterium RIFCSPLOWO2_02_FULL_38_14]OGL52326.1 MAG: hypothetical protein A3C43_03720 [Candidatus Schekmanbacteria bacterium RIFCSPHIGHO2_02_FULL_38_11]OGL55428.1 MAG: hypothetical protein A3G31_01280 [Candidatus Schekmanbacteria bacterium RIFCSPLOWO2_12_FULL_38_15]